MAHRKNEDFYLYTGLSPDNGECYDSLMHLQNIDINSFRFKHLHYGDPSQHAVLFASLKTWSSGLEDLKFPFVVYTKVYDFEDNPNKEVVFVKGFNEIQNTDWITLYNFSGTTSNTANTEVIS